MASRSAPDVADPAHPDPDGGMPTPAPRRGGHRRRRRVAAGVLVAVAVVAAVVIGVWVRRGAEPASLDDAARRFEESAGSTSVQPALLVPRPGVYRYTGDGLEELSVLQTGQRWGPELPATVTVEADGCWTFRIDYSTNHWQDTTSCADGGVLREVGGRTWQRFDFGVAAAEDTVVFTCEPANEIVRLDAAPGDSWSQDCTGRSDGRGTEVRSAGTTTFVGPEQLTIGGAALDVLHYRVDHALSGDQVGTEVTDTWYAAASGQVVRLRRESTVESPSPLGPVTYTESGALELADPEPVAG